MPQKIIGVFIFLFIIQSIFAEVLLLKDGTVVKGKIIKLDEDKVVILSNLDELIVERDQILKTYFSDAEYDLELTKMNQINEDVARLKLIEEQKASEDILAAEEALKAQETVDVVEEETKPTESEIIVYPLRKGGAGLLVTGLLISVAGAAFIGVDIGYFMPLALTNKANVENSINSKEPYNDYLQLFNVYQTSYNDHIAFFSAGVATAGLGVFLSLMSIPLLSYKKKQNLTFNITTGNKTSFAMVYSF